MLCESMGDRKLTTRKTFKTYRELRRLETFEERFEYLALKGVVGEETFGFERYLNQSFYVSHQWRQVRQKVIARDEGCDLGVPGYEIYDRIYIHHIVPMTVRDLEYGDPMVLNMDNLISTSHRTHNAIHYGDKSLLALPIEDRVPGDTRLW